MNKKQLAEQKLNNVVPSQSFGSGKHYIWISLICIILMLVTVMLKREQFIIPNCAFLPLHLILELSSIIFSFAVFITAWFGYKRSGNTKDLIIGVTFLATGVVDFIHTLSYQGMPYFLGPTGPGKAAAYWTFARLAASAGILIAMLVRSDNKSRWLSPCWLFGGAAVLVGGFITIVTVYEPAAGYLFFNPAKGGLTVLKVAIEYVVITIYLAIFFLLSETGNWDQRSLISMKSGLLMAIFAEIAFTLYSGPYGLINLIGHIFKAVAYYLIFSALFISVVRKPYEELNMAKEELNTLYLDAREHRKEIERSFSRIGNALSYSLKLEEALDQIAGLAMDMLHADCSMVISLDKQGKSARITAQKGDYHAEHNPVELTLSIGRKAIDQGNSIVENDLRSINPTNCDFTHSDCLRSVVCAPMIYEGDAPGVVAIFSHKENAFVNGDAKLLEAFASHAVVAIHNAMSYERESRIADVLQRSLLNSAKIVTDRFEIAQVYEPASSEALIGGDFYDVITLPDDKIALVIGDVSGKGLAAAVHTAMAKYALRAYIAEGHSPKQAIKMLNNVIGQFTSDETFITMFYGLIDTLTGEMVYTNGGHEPPIYAYGGTYDTLDSNGPVLGLGINVDYEERRLKLEKGSILLLYTDGVSEARNGRNLFGVDRIGKELLVCNELDCENTAKCVHQTALEFAGGELRDDAAILAVRVLR